MVLLKEESMTKITILGCGGAEGVPMIGCSCKVCRSKNPKNKRTRQSILVESDKTKLLIDAGPDLRDQSLLNKITKLDGILITHPHADHIGGLQELRAFCILSHKTINLFSLKKFLNDIKIRYDYLFRTITDGKDVAFPILKANEIELWKNNKIGDIGFIPFLQSHGRIDSVGFLFDGFAYSTDFKSLSKRSIDLLKGTKLWLVDCIGYKRDYFAHVGLKEMLALYEEIKPEKAVIIHLSHEIDYETFGEMLPKNISIAYDGMKFGLQ